MRNFKCRAPYCKASDLYSTAEYVKLVTKDRVFFIHVGVGGTSSDRDVRDPCLGVGGFIGVGKALCRFKLTIHNSNSGLLDFLSPFWSDCGLKNIPREYQFVCIDILPYNLLFCMNIPPFPFKLPRFNK